VAAGSAAAGDGPSNGMANANSNSSASDKFLIRTDHLNKIYVMGDQQVHALRGVTNNIERGTFVAIMGPSGSGKSTFMNIIGCLDKPTSGKYYLDGVDVSSLDRDQLAEIRNKKIGFVFQQFNLLARTSALENVELPLLYTTDDKKQFQQRAMDALDAVGLGQRHDHHPSQLSGGQQQRVAIARSLLCNPRLILADEPTGALDSKTSVEIMGIFQKLNKEKGMTIVIVTHEPDIAHYADRIIVFKDGHVLTDEQVAEPRNAARELENWQEEQFVEEESVAS
jgi:putative ABC transport system ATP-binding protein